MNQRQATDEALESAAGLNRYAMEGMNKLYFTIWGNSVHFSLRKTQSDSYEQAIINTKQRIAELLNLSGDDYVLEVGSGLGETARYLAKHHGCKVMATNYSEPHLNQARAMTIDSKMDHLIANQWADYHDLPYPDETFDAYLIQEALNHSQTKSVVISEAFRVLKPGGTLIASDQSTNRSLMTTPEQNRTIQRHGSDDLLNANGYANLLSEAGFNVTHIDDLSPSLGPHFAELVRRIEENYDALILDIDKDLVDWNLDIWRFAAEKAEQGAIGWHMFKAIKP